MDALALLCTLHADGPATLVRLRAADRATLEDVIAADPDELALLLRSSKLAAGRFQKEARQLLERVATAHASLEASTASEAAMGETAVRASNRHGASRASKRPPAAKPAAFDRVLAAWREADEVETATAEPTVAPARKDAIPVAEVDGLDAETSRVLAQAGVRDLQALADSDALTLSRVTQLSYSKLSRLCALARRVVPSASRSTPRQALERLSPSERPLAPQEPLLRIESDFVLEPQITEEGVGGPFA